MADIHLLTDPTPGLTHVTIACGDQAAVHATWNPQRVTCATCLAPLRPPAPASSDSGITEKAWLQQVQTLARAHRWQTYHPLHSQGSEPGWPDLVLVKGHGLLFAELKVPGGRVTPQQQQWLHALGQVEHVSTHLWYPDDLPTIMSVADHLRHRHASLSRAPRVDAALYGVRIVLPVCGANPSPRRRLSVWASVVNKAASSSAP